ncbi:hypothetical protein ACLKA6_016157 [Drosophila palustris]
MYRCVKVTEPDNYFQCIIWRNSRQEDIQIYKLDTVTYGTKPASFLSVRAMHQLAIDEKESFPIGASAVLQDFYVDDFISGGASVSEAISKMQQTGQILSRGNFKLRKWCSNRLEVLADVAEEDKAKFLKFNDGSDITKTLGLAWNPSCDNLLFTLSPLQESGKPTKRSILSTIARFYDPLGLIGPIIAKSKIFLQHLWKAKVDWDESLPASLMSAWMEIIESFSSISRFSFPRLVLDSQVAVEVHGFCDASIDAYGACVYIISRTEQPFSRLLCSKSRVAPLKTLTVPKLELSGAMLLAQLMHEIEKMTLFGSHYYCWSDSTVALSWIRSEPSKFNVFVSNRFLVYRKDDWPSSCSVSTPSIELRKIVLHVKAP